MAAMRKNTYIVPSGTATVTRGSLRSSPRRKSRARRSRCRLCAITGSPWVTAAMPARCTKIGAHDVLYSISLPRSATSAGGTTSQPRRQPVMHHDFENVLVLMTRSSGCM